MNKQDQNRGTMSRILLSAVVLALSIAAWGIMFRTETVAHPKTGERFYQHRWGRPARISMDVNRDGVIDSIAHVAGSFDDVYLLEESSLCNGVIDVRIEFSGDYALIFEYDSDQDGEYETILHSSEVYSALKNRPGVCKG